MLPPLVSVLSRIVEIEQRLGALQPKPPQAVQPASFAEALASARQVKPSLRRIDSPHQSSPHSQHNFDALIQAAATRHGVDADLIHAVIQAESDYNPSCQSSAGALGLMQLMPATARALGVSNPLEPAANIDAGVKYLRQQLDRFHEIDLALAAYNAGPGAVQRYHGVPPYRETQTYVRRVMQTLWQRKNQ